MQMTVMIDPDIYELNNILNFSVHFDDGY